MRRHAVALALCALAACTKTEEKVETVTAPRCVADADCDDGLSCNGVETCDAAGDRCVRGTPPSCDDSVGCTHDLCVEGPSAATCAHVPDSSACGFGELCSASGCAPAPECAVDADCDDGLFCNGTETCGADDRCVTGTAPVCDDQVACTVDFCDDLLDRCAHVGDGWACAEGERCSPASGCVAPAGCAADQDCDDGFHCNGAETCDLVNGVCTAGTRPVCDDQVACTVDLCDELLDRCVSMADGSRCAQGESCSPAQGCHVPASCTQDAQCDDGVYCNGAETCSLATGRCAAGTPPACGDAVACNVDLCDEAGDACVHLGEPAAAGCTELAVERTGTGSGRVTSAPAAIDCGSACSAWFEPSSALTLTAAPDLGSTFAGWSGACAGTDPCSLTMSAARSVTASFARTLYALAVSRTGGGTVASSPSGVYCGTQCAASFPSGTSVTLTASPDPGATFAGWSGACTGLAPACTVNVSGAASVLARFTFPLFWSTAGTGGGTVSTSPAGTDCGGGCETFDGGTYVTLTATPDATSTFTGWSGACTGTGECAVAMDVAREVMATFTRQVPSFTLALSRTGEGTVFSTPHGIYCGATCSERFASGSSVTLSATAASGWTFAGWTGACTGASPTCTITVNQAVSVGATFTRQSSTLTVTRSGAGAGTVTSTPSGISCGADCNETFPTGTVVALNAASDATSVFSGWSGACTGTGTCLVTMDAAKSVTATFAKASFTVAVTRSGTGSGSVTSSPAGISCGATCSASFTAGTSVVLTAQADTTSDFTGWTGACTGASTTCTVAVSQALSTTATFTRRSYALTVNRSGAGTVTSVPAGIYCGLDCSEAYAAGSSVTLTATPDAGATFTGWSGGGCSGTGACTVAMDAAKTVTAPFTYPLTVTKTGTGSGTVTSGDAKISCGASCATTYAPGATVTLTASAAAGSTFAGWMGSCSGTGSCTLTMDGARTVVATFTRQAFDLLVVKDGTGAGTVSSTPAGIACGGTCLATFDAATVVTLSASADATSDFAGWSGACSGTGECAVTMDGTKGAVATFARRTHALTVTRVGGGTVTSAPSGISCGLDCSEAFTAGSAVTLTAVVDAGATFTGWTGACAGTGTTCTVTMDGAKSVGATFTYPLTVAKTGTGSGTVTSDVPPISCGSVCAATYPSGTVVTLTAAVSPGSTFAGWTGACAGTGTCAVVMDAAKTVVATFERQHFDVLVVKEGAGGGTVTSTPAGIACGGSCLATFDGAATVTLSATADAASAFTGWSGACSGTGDCTLTMDATKAVVATFTPRHLLAVSRVGGGTVTSAPAGIACGLDCSELFVEGTTVTLTAAVDPGATFTGWSGACAGSAPTCAVGMSAARSVTATFTYPLAVAKAGEGAGTVTSDDSAISCGGTCGAPYAAGDTVTLTASAAEGSAFAGWSGACTGTGGCTVTMDAAKSVTATFDRLYFDLTVAKDGTGGGTVTSTTPAGISCGGSCTATFVWGTPVTLAAVGDATSDFAGWSGGGCSGTGECTVTMDAAKEVRATFTRRYHALTVAVGGPGQVTSSPAGIACGSACSAGFVELVQVTLSAVRDDGATFSGWSGACSGTSLTCTVTMDAAKSVGAAFAYPLTVTKLGAGSGTVVSDDSAIDCGGTCAADYGTAGTVTLSASAGALSTFAGWSGACSGTGDCVVTMDAARSVVATFDLEQLDLSVAKDGTGDGTVTSSPAGIACGGACIGTFDATTVVTLSASGDATSDFAGWSGAGCSGTGECAVTMDAAKSVTATFTRWQFQLSVAKEGTGGGTVTSSPAGIDYGDTSLASFDAATVVTLSAVGDATSDFGGWSGAGCSGTGECAVTMDAENLVTATFIRRYHALQVTVTGTGLVTSTPAGIDCGSTCGGSFVEGTEVTLTASGGSFSGWGDAAAACGSALTCTVTLDVDRSVSASFL